MPITLTASEAIELLKYGKYSLLSLSGTIPASEAVNITETPSLKPPSVSAVYSIKPGWAILSERLNWGQTSRPDKVYYELWQYGKPIPTPYAEGFYCGNYVKGSNLDDVNVHLYASEKIIVKLWNATGASPEDVYYDLTIWYYTYDLTYQKEVMAILDRTPSLLSEILEAIKAIKTVTPPPTVPPAAPPAAPAAIPRELECKLDKIIKTLECINDALRRRVI